MLEDLAADLGVKNTLVMMPIRVALSGKETSPGGSIELLVAFGRGESLARIKVALEKLA